jgi:transposase
MNKLPVFVGLDYHQSSVQVCVMDNEGQVLLNRPTENDFLSIVERVEHCGRVVRVGIEACCGAANLAEELVNQAGWIVDLAHPGYVARMKQSPDKTDFSDARMIADLERVGYLPRVWLAPEPIRELRQLIRYRQQLVNERRNAKLRICALLREHRLKRPSCRRWTLAWFAWLRQLPALNEHSRWILDQHLARLASLAEAIRAAEARLTDTTRDDAVVQRLLDLPGIGPVTAWMLRAEIGRFDRFQTGKQLSRFCGLSPRNASSGARQADAGLIRAGNSDLRAVLIQAAHRLINGNEQWGAFADRLLAKGKPKCVAVAAVANRWIRWLFHQMQPETHAA